MSKAQNDFNSIARIYDPLSKLVFGKRLIEAQIQFIGRLPTEGKALFIGGGSGAILPKIWARKPRLHLDFIDGSQKMINMAEKQLRTFPNARVSFISGTENDLEQDAQYDAILTFFFLDLFEDSDKLRIAKKLCSHLKEDGIWLHADFHTASDKISKLREKIMFSFFKKTTRIEANEISDDAKVFDELGLGLIDKKEFGRDVYAAVFTNSKTLRIQRSQTAV